MLMIVRKPRHWWIRAHYVHLPIWPTWLAQRLCNHQASIEWNAAWKPEDNKVYEHMCRDCNKFLGWLPETFPETQ